MRYLALALFAEGPTDHAFLHRLLYRATHEAAMLISETTCEVSEIFVRGAKSSADHRDARIVEAFTEPIRQGAASILFIHSDGANDPISAKENNISPGVILLGERCSGQ